MRISGAILQVILSYSRKFVFIKGVKVAGTSAEVFLSQICNEADILAPLRAKDEAYRATVRSARIAQNFHADQTKEAAFLHQIETSSVDKLQTLKPPQGSLNSHISLSDVEDLFGTIPKDFKIIGIDRCPYQKVISAANYALMELKVNSVTPSPSSDYLQSLRSFIDQNITEQSLATLLNLSRYKDKAGKLRTHILRYESFEETLKRFVHGLTGNHIDMPHLKRGLLSEKLDIKNCLSDDVIMLINSFFEEEFHTYGYKKIHP